MKQEIDRRHLEMKKFNYEPDLDQERHRKQVVMTNDPGVSLNWIRLQKERISEGFHQMLRGGRSENWGER